jgi:WD40 repeat protein
LAISPDGKVLACAFTNPGRAEIALYETATGRKITDLARDVILTGNPLVYAPDGKTIASVSSSCDAIHFYDAITGKKQRMEVPSGQDVIHRLAWSADGKKLAWLAQNGFIHLWDVDKGHEIGRWKGHDNDEEIYKGGCKAFAPDGKTLATGGREQTIRLWDVATHKEKHRLDGKHGSIHAVIFSRDGRVLASGHRDGTIALWDAAKGEEIRRWQAHTFWIMSLDFSPNGKTLVSGAAWECGPRLWDVATGTEVRPFAGHTAVVERVLFSQGGKHILSLGREKNILDWDLRSGREPLYFQLPFHAANPALDCYTLAPQGDVVASWGYKDDIIRLLDLATGKERRTLGKFDRSEKESGLFAAMEFSPDGRSLAVGTKDGVVTVWDVATGVERSLRKRVAGSVLCVAFSRDGQKIAAGTAGNPTIALPTIALWDVKTGKSLAEFSSTERVDRLAFSPDGKMLASASWVRGTLHLWDATTGRQIRPLESAPALYDVAFSPDGKWLAGAGDDKDLKIHIWEVNTGLKARTFCGHIAAPLSVTFAPNGRTLASGGADSSILLWDFTGRMKDDRLQTVNWTPRELEKRWIDLASSAGSQAVQTLWDLVASPEQAVPLLRQRIKPVEPADVQRVERLIRDLDSEDFETRAKATEGLEKIVDGAEPVLRKKLTEKPALEMKQRINQVLSKLEPAASGDRLRALRAVQVLEYTGTPEAEEHLRALAKGVAEARLTREAKAALDRLAK